MTIEKATMARFVELIEKDEPLVNPLFNRYQVYRDMVYYRFYETITNVYPLLCNKLGEKLPPLIREFQRYSPKSPLMSEMAHEFGTFLKNRSIDLQFPYLEDLLWLEWSEMSLLLETFDDTAISFEWERNYTLSSSVRIRQMHYPLYRVDFESYGEYPLMLYYAFNEDRVYFEEITPLGYDLLLLLKNVCADEALQKIALLYKVDPHDLKEPLTQLFKQWCDKKILTKGG